MLQFTVDLAEHQTIKIFNKLKPNCVYQVNLKFLKYDTLQKVCQRLSNYLKRVPLISRSSNSQSWGRRMVSCSSGFLCICDISGNSISHGSLLYWVLSGCHRCICVISGAVLISLGARTGEQFLMALGYCS